jgi:hypothetical protein
LETPESRALMMQECLPATPVEETPEADIEDAS